MSAKRGRLVAITDVTPDWEMEAEHLEELRARAFEEARQLRTFFRTGSPLDQPASVTVNEADTVRLAIRAAGFNPGDVVPERIAQLLRWLREEER